MNLVPFGFLCCQLISAVSLGNISPNTVDHIVVLPDIHGDLEFFLLSVLTAAKRTNYPDLTLSALEELLTSQAAAPAPEGIPSRTIVIQLGDVANRGPGSKQCFAVLYGLEKILGWKVVTLYGNHELMAFTGKDSQYVHEVEYDIFGGPGKRAAEFSREGSLWRLIHSRSILVARLGGESQNSLSTLFVHAGIESAWLAEVGVSLSQSVDSLNSLARSAMITPGLATTFFSGKSSPLWTRAFEKNSHSQNWCDTELNEILDRFKVSRIVVGHCPSRSKRVETRCDGRIILADVKMSRWMHEGGQPMALIMSLSHLNIQGETDSEIDSIVAHYVDDQDPTKEFSQEIAIWAAPRAAAEVEDADVHKLSLPQLGRSVSADSLMRLFKNRPQPDESAIFAPRSPCFSRACAGPLGPCLPPKIIRAVSCQLPSIRSDNVPILVGPDSPKL